MQERCEERVRKIKRAGTFVIATVAGPVWTCLNLDGGYGGTLTCDPSISSETESQYPTAA